MAQGDAVNLTYLGVLADWGKLDNFTEEDLWEAIKEANGIDGYIEDGDLTEWL